MQAPGTIGEIPPSRWAPIEREPVVGEFGPHQGESVQAGEDVPHAREADPEREQAKNPPWALSQRPRPRPRSARATDDRRTSTRQIPIGKSIESKVRVPRAAIA